MTRASITLCFLNVLVLFCALGVGLRLAQLPAGHPGEVVPHVAAESSFDLKDGTGECDCVVLCLPVPMIDAVGIACAAHCIDSECFHTETVPAGVHVQRGPPCC